MIGRQDMRHRSDLRRSLKNSARTMKGTFVTPTPAPLLSVMDDSKKKNYLEITSSFPFFGGEDEPNSGANAGAGAGNGTGSGGNSTATSSSGSGNGEDPIKKLQSDPTALAQLLSQSQTLNTTVADLTAKLEAATTENAGFKQKQEEADAAQRTKEQNQEIEINKLKGQIENLAKILQEKVIENAIGNNSKYQWNSIRQVRSELDMSKLKVNLDVDKGIAEIDGMDAELDRIATASSWLVKSAEVINDAGTGSSRRRNSGNPPRPPQGPQDAAAKRAAAMKRYPVLATGVPAQ